MEEKDYFINCGGYASKLSKIAQEILEERRKNGEIITKKDVDFTANSLYEAYNTIVANFNDDKFVSKAVDDLAIMVDRLGDISNIVELADEVSKKIAYEEFYKENDEENIGLTGISAVAMVGNGLAKGFAMENIVNKLYGTGLQKQINTMYAQAMSGDINSIAKINEIDKITSLADANETLDEKSTRGMLARMMRMAALNDETNNQVLTQLAEHYNMDIFQTDKSGNKILDINKLQDKYHDSVSKVNPKAAQMTIDDFKKIAMKSAQREKEKGTFSKLDQTIQSSVEQKAKNRELIQFEKIVNSAYRNKEYSTVKKFLNDNPDLGRKMVEDVFEWQKNVNPLGPKSSQLQMQGELMCKFMGIEHQSIKSNSQDVKDFISKSNIKIFPNNIENSEDREQ